MTQALILAAGMGTRLMPLTADRPKVLVEVAGEALLGRMLRSCNQVGLSSAVVVTGYLSHTIDQWLVDHPPPLPVTTVLNPEFDTRGNAWSVACGRPALDGDFIKLDGDVVLDPAILRLLLAQDGSGAAIDTRGELDAEAMKASVVAGRVSAFGKWLSLDDAAGESIGIEKIAAADMAAVMDGIVRRVETEPGVYYEDVYHQLIAEGRLTMAAVDIGERWWSEVDDQRDLARAGLLVQ